MNIPFHSPKTEVLHPTEVLGTLLSGRKCESQRGNAHAGEGLRLLHDELWLMSAFNTMRKPKDPQEQKKSMCLGKEVIQDTGREVKTEGQDPLCLPCDIQLRKMGDLYPWEMQG